MSKLRNISYLLTSFIIVIALFFSLTPVQTYAASIFNITTIKGHIDGPNGKPLVLANVTVTCDGKTQHTITGVNGNYVAIFVGENVCGNGSTVSVTATKNGQSGGGSGTVQTDRSGRFVDVNFSTLDFSVPEFGLLPGAVAAIASIGLYFTLRRKQKAFLPITSKKV